VSTAPYWITCDHCGEKRDASSRYTSPTNAERDRQRWAEEHFSGRCIRTDRSESTAI